jgi:hypothetical protein
MKLIYVTQLLNIRFIAILLAELSKEETTVF